jgi:hypothetical protein
MAIVVDEPIINSPFAEPTRHHRTRGGQAELQDARRPSEFTPGLRTRGGQDTLLEEEHVEIIDDLKFGDEHGRRIMFPQVLRIVQRYIDSRVAAVGGAALDEVALGPYRREIGHA